MNRHIAHLHDDERPFHVMEDSCAQPFAHVALRSFSFSRKRWYRLANKEHRISADKFNFASHPLSSCLCVHSIRPHFRSMHDCAPTGQLAARSIRSFISVFSFYFVLGGRWAAIRFLVHVHALVVLE